MCVCGGVTCVYVGGCDVCVCGGGDVTCVYVGG